MHTKRQTNVPSNVVANVQVHILYFRNAATVYGNTGLMPATPYSVGVDLRACPVQDEPIRIPGHGRCHIPTGIAIEPLQPHIAGFVYSRSGLGAKVGVTVAQGVGIIDPDYRGEITIYMLNTTDTVQTLLPGDRIAQLVMQPYATPVFTVVETLTSSERGEGGYGHTGKA